MLHILILFLAKDTGGITLQMPKNHPILGTQPVLHCKPGDKKTSRTCRIIAYHPSPLHFRDLRPQTAVHLGNTIACTLHNCTPTTNAINHTSIIQDLPKHPRAFSRNRTIPAGKPFEIIHMYPFNPASRNLKLRSRRIYDTITRSSKLSRLT